MNQPDEYAHLEAARLAGATIYGIADDGTLHVVGKGELKPQYTCPPDRYVSLVPFAELGQEVGADADEFGWHEGQPPHWIASEWFIALLMSGERAVLTALPEEYTYDFKTADDTYFKADRIKKWMQFPDSQFIAYRTPMEAGPKAADAAHNAISRALDEAGITNAVHRGMCLEVGLERFADSIHSPAHTSEARDAELLKAAKVMRHLLEHVDNSFPPGWGWERLDSALKDAAMRQEGGNAD